MELRPGVGSGRASGTVKSSSHHYHGCASSHTVMWPLYCCYYGHTAINTTSSVTRDLMHCTLFLKVSEVMVCIWEIRLFIKSPSSNITTRWVYIKTTPAHLLSTPLRLHSSTKVSSPLAMISMLEKDRRHWGGGKEVVCIFIAIISRAPSSTP